MEIPLVDLRRQYSALRPEIDGMVEQVLTGAQYIMGENVTRFEEEFAQYLQVKHAVSVGNGTDALVIALEALGIGPGDEVITSPYTFFATAEAVARVGAVPVFVDVREDTYNLDENRIEEKITKKTRAILPVHIFGQCADMQSICGIAQKHGLYVIEDACQAAGARFENQHAGSFGDISCFSFFPTKNLSCAGDGGMICTNQEHLAIICRALRAHGGGAAGERAYRCLHGEKQENIGKEEEDNTVYNEKKYYNYLIAHNSRLDEIQAVILRKKLKNLEKYVESRRAAAQFYNESLADLPITLPQQDEKCCHSYHLYVLQSERRDHIVDCLKRKGIATGIYYPVPLHLQKCFSYLKGRPGDCPVAEGLSEKMFAIPMFPEITVEECGYVAEAVREALSSK